MFARDERSHVITETVKYRVDHRAAYLVVTVIVIICSPARPIGLCYAKQVL